MDWANRDLEVFVVRCWRFAWRSTMMYRSSYSLRKRQRGRERTATCRPFWVKGFVRQEFPCIQSKVKLCLGRYPKTQAVLPHDRDQTRNDSVGQAALRSAAYQWLGWKLELPNRPRRILDYRATRAARVSHTRGSRAH